DVNGNDWLQTFESVSASLVDTGSGPTTANPGVACFTGSFGSTERSCEVLPGSRSFSVHTTRPLHASETLTFVAAFSKGYFTPMSWAERYREWLIASPAFLLQLFAVRSAHKKWQKLGKDPKKRGITVPYFERPKGMSVMQAAYVLENRLLPKHISATIIDLAVRGYLKIVEEKQRFSTKHQLILQKLPDSENTEGEKILVNELFDTVSVGSTVKLEDKKNKLYKALDTLTKHIDEKSAQAGYYQLSPKKAGGKFIAQIGLAVLALIAGFIFADSTNGVSVMTGFATLIAIIIYGASMTKRSVEGNMLVEHMEGVKLYLNQAEKDRIKNQDAVAAPLSPHSGEPMRDVKFFEKLLPFAVAMGVEKTWAKAFADIYSQPPDWYSGNWRTFSAVALADSLSKTTTATASAFSSPSSSGGSGFGGGGGAGGGGGGGGGGGW
ncbi:DUF2207 domain-containing protein, partial [Candidatus Saccharibacteria bacterium]|nr:DUF2207 domain-containing protein [Candidatus Saccharibacteria bacterium]